jgi:predicted Zn-dependent protease
MAVGRKFARIFCTFAALPILLVRSQEVKPVASSSTVESALAEADELYRKGLFDQALAKYNEFIKTDPRSVRAITGIARSYLEQQKVSDAAAIVDKALAADPSVVDLKVVRGEILFRQGKIGEFRKGIRRTNQLGREQCSSLSGPCPSFFRGCHVCPGIPRHYTRARARSI